MPVMQSPDGSHSTCLWHYHYCFNFFTLDLFGLDVLLLLIKEIIFKKKQQIFGTLVLPLSDVNIHMT